MTDAFHQIWKIHQDKKVPVRPAKGLRGVQGSAGAACTLGAGKTALALECRARWPPLLPRSLMQLRTAAFIKALNEVTRAELHRGFD